jgi:hypothetical protein
LFENNIIESRYASEKKEGKYKKYYKVYSKMPEIPIKEAFCYKATNHQKKDDVFWSRLYCYRSYQFAQWRCNDGEYYE